MFGATMARRRTTLFLFFILALAVPAHAQEYTEDLDVRIIQIPVVVSHQMKAVDGLNKDDFEVFINGERQPIAYFDVLDFTNEELTAPREGAAPSRPAPDSLAQRRLTLLVFDVYNSTYGNLSRMRGHVQDFVQRLRDDDLVAVAAYYGGDDAQHIVPFTRDRQIVVRAAATLKRSIAGDALALTMTPEERAAFADPGTLAPPTGSTESEFGNELARGVEDFERTIDALNDGQALIPSVLEQIKTEQQWQSRTAAEAWAHALGTIAEDLKPLEGIKQVVLLTEGLHVGETSTAEFGKASRILNERFRNSGVTMSVIDIAGLRAPGGARLTTLVNEASTPEILHTAALGTGGRVISDIGISKALELFTESRGITYLLGLKPPANEKDRNEIEVKVRNRPAFAQISYPRGYSRTEPGISDVSGLVLADAMLNDYRRNDVTVRVLVQNAGKPAVVDVGVPSTELLAHADAGRVTVDFFIYVFDDKNEIRGWKHRRMRLEESKARKVLKGAEIVRRERFELEPGAYTVKALVHVVGRDLLGIARTELARAE
jgi:VWFA-related protein